MALRRKLIRADDLAPFPGTTGGFITSLTPRGRADQVRSPRSKRELGKQNRLAEIELELPTAPLARCFGVIALRSRPA
jgi:hypothetical protein